LSRIDNSQRVLGVPGLLKRRSAADVNLRDGETLVIAGLTSHERSLEGSGIPVLSGAPGVGRLFGTRARRSEDSELVIFLTPRVVKATPADAGAAADPAADALQRARTRIDEMAERR
jgi:pilus assembly protein CpaC